MRPMESDGDHFLSYYLTQKDDDAIQFKQNRAEHLEQSLAEILDETESEQQVGTQTFSVEGESVNGMVQVTPFHFVRDYETIKVEQEVPNEFLLLFDDEAQPPTANYKNIERKIILKKKRVNVSRGLSFPLILTWANGFVLYSLRKHTTSGMSST
jgi:RNA polymerase II-associated factor 1